MSSPSSSLRAVDRLEVFVLVDNVLDLLSTVPPDVTPEVPNLVRAGMREFSGSCLCCAAWGLSLLVTAHVGSVRHTVLFDAGPESYAFERNARRLGVDLGSIEAAVLSHGHFDHAGGLPQALRMIHEANGGRAVPLHVNPGMFGKRAFKLADGHLLPLGDVPTLEELSAAGGAVVNSSEARTLLDDLFFVSGEIARVTPYEKGLPQQFRLADEGGWLPDPLVLDERYLAVHVRDQGLVVFSACSHAGIVNVLKDAAGHFPSLPLHAAMGGLHLSGPFNERWIDDTVRDLQGFGLKRLIPGHCTGWRATQALVRALGDVVVPGAVGQLHRFGQGAHGA
ncbi:MBL fold metallo-hydrolase [Cystobacter ferrugineus]|uniref:MBL fold metallo-hydrolase n=1 Tax=Cystobacter ferrugineus TaxID=83449 RepID=A0A1L9B1Y5_9BACT|nr:MBL fold metallo-hydrolase [Cystobacter ferrugineus]OJH36250.1 MBL fold metallo-hydrolase [Cystobacter ferrugineus]